MPNLEKISKNGFRYNGSHVTAFSVLHSGIWYYAASGHITPDKCQHHGFEGSGMNLEDFTRYLRQYQCKSYEWVALIQQNKVRKLVEFEDNMVHGRTTGFPGFGMPCPGPCVMQPLQPGDKRFEEIEDVLYQLKDKYDKTLMRIEMENLGGEQLDVLLMTMMASKAETYNRAASRKSRN